MSEVIGQVAIGATYEHIGLKATLHKSFYTVLGRLGFQFACRSQVRYKGQVDYNGIVIAQFPLELSDSFYIRQGFYVAHSPPDFGDDNIILTTFAKELDAVFDFVGDVRDHLYCFSKELTAAFFFNNTLVDTTCGNIVGLRGIHIEKTFVVPQV